MLLPILELCKLFCCISWWLEVIIPLCLGLQLEQFNMIENAISSNSLYSPCSTLNYSQAAMMGLTGSHGSLQDSQQLNYSSHGNIPNIILTGKKITDLTNKQNYSGVSVSLHHAMAHFKPRKERGIVAFEGFVSPCVNIGVTSVVYFPSAGEPDGSCLIPANR